MAVIKVGYSDTFVKRCMKLYEDYTDEEMIRKKQKLIDGFQEGKISSLDFSKKLSKMNACLVGRGIKG